MAYFASFAEPHAKLEEPLRTVDLDEVRHVVQLQIEELTSDAELCDGDVLAVTRHAVDDASVECQQILRQFEESAGQFMIFRGTDDGFLPVRTAEKLSRSNFPPISEF